MDQQNNPGKARATVPGDRVRLICARPSFRRAVAVSDEIAYGRTRRDPKANPKESILGPAFRIGSGTVYGGATADVVCSTVTARFIALRTHSKSIATC